MKEYIVVIDQGTTSSRVLLINKKIEIVDIDYINVNIKTNSEGIITQSPDEIISSVKDLLERLFKRNDLDPKKVASIAITNQRETTIIWNKKTGKPIYDAISWQSKHTKRITDEWIESGYNEIVMNKTGLRINPYFSASKIKDILERSKIKDSTDLIFGTIDTFLLWHLSIEKAHKTDITNASRTMLYNIKSNEWDIDLLALFKIEKSLLPTVHDNDHLFGHFKYNDTLIPINTMIGDQQSALFGHLCLNEGDTKITYGTGCFILINTGDSISDKNNGLLNTIAWKINDKINYALEGSVFSAGFALSYFKKNLDLFSDIEKMEFTLHEAKNDNVYVVPAFSGLGAPYWDNDVKAAILGIDSSTTKIDIFKATLNSIAFQVNDVLNLVSNENMIKVESVSVDGGVSNNQYLMQFQANLSNVKLIQNIETEITALGACYISGLSAKIWNNVEEIKKKRKIKTIFTPVLNRDEIEQKYQKWQKAVITTISFK